MGMYVNEYVMFYLVVLFLIFLYYLIEIDLKKCMVFGFFSDMFV